MINDWKENTYLIKAYNIAFDEAYATTGIREFLEVMEKRMSEALIKHLKNKALFEDVLEEVMADAENHYMELSIKYREV